MPCPPGADCRYGCVCPDLEPTPEFAAWPKIARLNRDIVVTEKLDGTNAAVGVTEGGIVYAQSRKRIITPESDNYGFARWVQEHADELQDGLGVGLHFGEWYGQGIQRGYGLAERRFALFNTARWIPRDTEPELAPPSCCYVVPVLYEGPFSQEHIDNCINVLRRDGSVAAPGFMQPEGVVVWHTAARVSFKVTLEGDEKPKGSREP